MNTANSIKRLRQLLGLSQAAFAKHIGITQAYLCQIETGQRPMLTKTYNAILKQYGNSINEQIIKLKTELTHLEALRKAIK